MFCLFGVSLFDGKIVAWQHLIRGTQCSVYLCNCPAAYVAGWLQLHVCVDSCNATLSPSVCVYIRFQNLVFECTLKSGKTTSIVYKLKRPVSSFAMVY